MRICLIFAIVVICTATPMLDAGQSALEHELDLDIANPAFARNGGPHIAIDEGHFNYHTGAGRFAPFAELLRNDGFNVASLVGPITADALHDVDILVVSNALNKVNKERWSLPTPSAFTAGEIAAIETWTKHGGALLLIADHFPFPGAAAELARAFGFTFHNSFVFQYPVANAIDLFTRESGALRDHIVTRGRNATESITNVATFAGSAFQAPPSAVPLLVFQDGYVVLLPSAAWEFDENTPQFSANGHLQGALLEHGKGRIAVFGEAGMFTVRKEPDESEAWVGFNVPEAAQNKQFILNLMRWLSGYLP